MRPPVLSEPFSAAATIPKSEEEAEKMMVECPSAIVKE